MSRLFKYIVCLVLVFIAFDLRAKEPVDSMIFTHADAAVVFAKYSGYFDRYVSTDASLNDCVTFLNKTGIYFGLMEVVSGKEFTRNDFARVMGQMSLVFLGSAEYDAGKVKLPDGVATWESFCAMNGVDFIEGYHTVLKRFVLVRGRESK